MNVNGRRFDRVRIAVNQQPIARLQHNVLGGIPGKCCAEIYAEDLEFAVRQVPKDLRIFFLRVRGKTTRQMNRIPQPDLAGSPVGSRRSHISPDRHNRRIFKIKPAENTHRIHRMQHRRLRGIGKRISQIKALDRRMKIRRIQTNNLRIVGGGLGQQILVGGDHVRNAHILAIRVPPRTDHVAVEINRVLVVGRDRKNPDAIAVLDLERFQLLGYFRGVSNLRYV